MVTFAYTSNFVTEIELFDTGAGSYSALSNFSLDLEEAWETFWQYEDSNEGNDEPPELVSIESNRIEAIIDGYVFVLTGSGITPATNIDALGEDIDSGIATGAFSTVTVTGPLSAGGPNGEILRFTTAANGTGYTLSSGGQSFVVIGALPNTLVGLADMLRTFGQLGTLFELSTADQQNLATELNGYGVTGLQIVDNGNTIFSVAVTPTSFTVAFGAMTLVVNGIMPTNFGDIVRIAIQIESIGQVPGALVSLTQIDGLAIDSARLSGPNNVTLLDVTGPIIDSASIDAATTTFNGTVVGEFDVFSSYDDYYSARADVNVRYYGMAGNDYLTGSNLNDILFGGTGDDTLHGMNGNDTIYSDEGDDFVYGGGGNDTLYSGDGNDRVDGGEGRDLIGGGAGVDLIYGGNGDDRVFGGNDNDTLYGGAGNDLVGGDTGNDMLFGEEGNDTLWSGAGDDTIYGGVGDDIVNGLNDRDLLFGGAGNDTIWGSNGSDTMHGEDDNDIMGGGSWSDVMYGGNGSDVMFGDTGNDTIFGGDGADDIKGNNDNDSLFGGAGNDTIWSDDGNDFSSGGDGNDLMSGGNGNDGMYGDAGNDTLWGGAGDDRMGGDSGDDILRAGDGNDTVWGGVGNDIISGDGGNDLLSDGAGNDTVYGDAGNDTFMVGSGNDLLFGGAGADTFVFSAGTGNDTIRGFSIAEGDNLMFSTNLWGGATLTAAVVVATYASVTSAGVVLTFSAGNEVILEGLTSTTNLESVIDFTL